MERSKLRARELVFWPGMSKQIEDVVSNCTTCQQLRLSHPKEPMIPHEIPQYPWQIVASDLFEWNGGSYVLVVDYYSRYWEVAVLHSTTSTAVINKLRQIFARHGIPETVKSDNGPQYSSAEFDTFAANWKFSHVTSSPKYPQSNGLAEKTVQTAKRMLEKAKRDRRDPYLALLEQRNTPVASYKSPAQLSMGRHLRSLLPCTTNHLIPETVCYRETQSMFQKKQAEQKSNYDKSAVPLQPLKTGEAVRVKQECEWRPGKVIEIADTPRSYLAETPEGAVYRRNRRHLHRDAEYFCGLVNQETGDEFKAWLPSNLRIILLSKLTIPKYKLAVDNKSDFNTIYFTLLHIYFAGDCFWRFYLFVHAESIEKEAISRQKSLECRGYKFVWTRDDEHILIFEQCSTASSTGKTTPARETASMRKFCNQAAGNSDDLENSFSY